MNNNTLHRGGSTLPPHSNPAQLDDGRRRTISDPPHLSVPEPFQSIPAQELLKDNCGYCGWIRKEGGSIKTCEFKRNLGCTCGSFMMLQHQQSLYLQYMIYTVTFWYDISNLIDRCCGNVAL